MTPPIAAHSPSIILDAKLEPPPLRSDLVPRSRLLGGIAARDPGVVVACAPAGCGKSILLAQRASASGRPVAWVSMDEADDDPVLLLGKLAEAIGRAGALDERVRDELRRPRPALERLVLPGLLNALGAGVGTLLVIDDLHLVGRRECRELVAFICEHLPPRARLLLATRPGPALPLGRPRAHADLLELGPRDLAFDPAEVAALLHAAGARSDDEAVRAVTDRTEGWPAGVAMAALTAGDAAAAARPVAADGDDATAHFARELLFGQPAACVDFVLRSSVLERFCAPLCDAVLERCDSAAMIARLDATGLFVVPLDGGDGWFRYHRLFRDVIRAELRRRDADAARALHRRAAEWHRRDGDLEDAIHHALAAEDMEPAADLVVEAGRALLVSGRHATAQAWIDRFGDEDMLRSGALALTGACLAGLRGEKERARRDIAIAERASWQGAGPLGERSRESALALTRALFGWEGVSRMRALALRAYEGEPVGFPAHEAAALALGTSLALLGRTGEAVPRLEEAAALGPERGTITLVARSQLGRLCLADEMLDEAEHHVAEGLALARRLGLQDWTGSAALLALAAELDVARGGDGREPLALAVPLLVRGAPFPWSSIQTLTALGGVAIAAEGPAAAAALLRRARQGLARYPDAGVLPRMLARAEHRLEEARGGGGTLDDHVTAAEMRVLELLPTHLGVEEVAEMLHVSKSTVKSHLRAIYRKLGVSRRSDAVAAARQHGILTEEDLTHALQIGTAR